MFVVRGGTMKSRKQKKNYNDNNNKCSMKYDGCKYTQAFKYFIIANNANNISELRI